MQISSSKAPQKVRLTAHIDASEPASEPYWAARIDDVQQAASSSEGKMEGAVRLFRSGKSPLAKTFTGLRQLGYFLAAPAAGFAVGGPIGLAVGLAADVGMFYGGTFRSGTGNLLSAYQHHDYLPDGDWKGSVTAPLDGAKHNAPTAAEAHPDGAELGQFLSDNLQKDALNVVFLAGHGLGVHQAAGLKTAEVTNALQQASEKTGAVPDVLLMESCLTSNAETLSMLQGKAHVAILSEEVIKLSESRLPLQEMLAEATQGGTAQEIATRMLDHVAQDKGVLTLAAVDVDKFGAVKEDLGKLGAHLVKAIADGKQHELQEAVKGAMKYPNFGIMPLEKAILHNSDLGMFLDNLQKTSLGDETKAVVGDTRKALDDSILAKTNGTGYEQASGVAFQTDTGFLDKNGKLGSFHDADFPPTWQLFVQMLWQKDAQATATALLKAVQDQQKK